MQQDIKNYLKTCQSCQVNKTNRKPNKNPMEITTTSENPFDKIYLDIVGPLPLTLNGNKYILTIQDDLTKFSYAYPCENHESVTIANNLVKFISIFGIPSSILTDLGTDFNSSLMKDVVKLLQIKHLNTTPYHPQTNGALERSHSTLKDYLKHFINREQTNWDEYVHLAMYAYNTNIHNTTKFMPFQLIFGRDPRLPSSIVQSPEFKYTYDNYYDNLKHQLNKSFQIARENIDKSKTNSKTHYDAKTKIHEYNIGDLVYLENNANKKGISKKLSPNWLGPYKIIEIYKNQNVLLKIKNKNSRVHSNRIKRAHLVSDGSSSSSSRV